MERISSRAGPDIEVSPAEVALLRTRAESVAASIVAAEGELAAHPTTAARAGLLLEAMRPHVDELEALEGRFALSGEGAPVLAERLERERARVAALSAEVKAANARASGLDALLADVASETRPKIARLPNPRPPPVSAEQVVVFCRYGRVMLVDLPGMMTALNLGVRDALGDNRVPGWDDRVWLANLFSKARFGSGNFYWSIREEEERTIFADIAWIDRSYGERLADLQRGDSELMRALSTMQRTGRYLRFYVWSDSFEVYLEARYLAEQMGWPIGWLPIEKSEEVGQSLTGGHTRQVILD